jgi:hypothetical protein
MTRMSETETRFTRTKLTVGGPEKRKLATGSTAGQSYNPGMDTYPDVRPLIGHMFSLKGTGNLSLFTNRPEHRQDFARVRFREYAAPLATQEQVLWWPADSIPDLLPYQPSESYGNSCELFFQFGF